MSQPKNETLIRQVFGEVYNRANLSVIDQVFATDYIDHSAPRGFPPGLGSFKQAFTMFRAAFPDLHVTVEDVISDGDKVVACLTFRGTHEGELLGIPPTQKRPAITGIAIDRILDGKIVEHWVNRDDLSMLQQLGFVPAI